jgi:hypothetical protein
MQTLAEWCRERSASPGTARRVYDRLFPTGPRAGLYRLVTDQQSTTLETELRRLGHLRQEPAVA